MPLIQTLQYHGYIPQLVGKGIPHRVTLDGWQKYSVKLLGRNCPFRSFMQVLTEDGRKVRFILLWIRIRCLFQWYKFSLFIIFFIPTILDLLTKTNVEWIHRPVTHPIPPSTAPPRSTSPTWHNAPVYNRNVANSCIVGYFADALWNFGDRSINY